MNTKDDSASNIEVQAVNPMFEQLAITAAEGLVKESKTSGVISQEKLGPLEVHIDVAPKYVIHHFDVTDENSPLKGKTLYLGGSTL